MVAVASPGDGLAGIRLWPDCTLLSLSAEVRLEAAFSAGKDELEGGVLTWIAGLEVLIGLSVFDAARDTAVSGVVDNDNGRF